MLRGFDLARPKQSTTSSMIAIPATITGARAGSTPLIPRRSASGIAARIAQELAQARHGQDVAFDAVRVVAVQS